MLPSHGTRLDIQVFFSPNPSIIANAFFATRDRASRLEPAMREAVQIVSQELDENFQVGGRPAWEELTDATVERKERDPELESDPEQILVRSGVLWSEMSDPGNWQIISSGNATTATLEDPTEYGHFHLEGTRFMPVRDFTDIPDEAIARIEQVFLDYVTAGW